MHIVNIYAKGSRWEIETLYLEVVPLRMRKMKYTGSFRFDHTKQLYSGDKPFYDQIMTTIRVSDGIVKLKRNDNLNFIPINIPEPEEVSYSENEKLNHALLVHRRETPTSVFDIIYSQNKQPSMEDVL